MGGGICCFEKIFAQIRKNGYSVLLLEKLFSGTVEHLRRQTRRCCDQILVDLYGGNQENSTRVPLFSPKISG